MCFCEEDGYWSPLALLLEKMYRWPEVAIVLSPDQLAFLKDLLRPYYVAIWT